MIEKYVDAEEPSGLLSVLCNNLGGLIIAGLFRPVL